MTAVLAFTAGVLLSAVVASLLVSRCHTRWVLKGQRQAELAHGGWTGALSPDPATAMGRVKPDAWADRDRQQVGHIVGYR